MSRSHLRTPWLDEDPDPRRLAGRQAARAAERRGEARRSEAPRPTAEPPAKQVPSVVSAPIPPWVAVGGALAGLLEIAGVILAVGGNKQAMGAVITGPLLLAITWVIARRLAALDRNPQIVPIVLGGFCFKLVGSLLRYWIAAVVYHTGDFYDYDKWGRRIADGLRHGHVISQPGRLAGTHFMRYVTGYIYVVTPARVMSGFLVYGFLSFVGILFFWRAYRVAVSTTHDVTYLKWVMLLPSLLYWPSAIGKDAFMVLAVGVASYGAACLISGRFVSGVIAIGAGIAAMCYVRPHIALAVCAGLVLAVLVGRKQGGFMPTLLSIAFIVGLASLVLSASSSFFGISNFNQATIAQQLSDVSAQSNDGGSRFTPIIANNPVTFPLAAVTVLYRPLPIEASSGQEFLTGIEGLVLIVMTVRTFKRSARAIRSSRTHPYFVYCLGALVVFVIAFSGISNFGILARQRTVIEPLLLVFLTLPKDFGDDVYLPPGRKNDRFVRPPLAR
jgi:hypothetical protein